MAADLPPSHQQPAQSTSTYSAQHAASLFDAFLHQSDAALPPSSGSSSPEANPASSSQRSSLSPLALAYSPSPSSSSSLAAALGSPSPPPGTSERRPLPAARSPPEPKSSGTPGPDTQEDHEQTPSHSEAQKSKAHLSAYQPLTAHGKPRERVYLACLQCRNRKVRCDGAKPECFNCVKRADPTAGSCSYDAAPRRRGKDRTPGSRRLVPLEPKKTRTTRSRVEEEQRRKKAEAAQAASRASALAESPIARDPPSHGPTSGVSPNYPDTDLSRPESQKPSAFASVSSVATPPGAPPAAKHHPMRTVSLEPQIVMVRRQFNLNPIEFRDFELTFAHPDAIAIACQVEEEEYLDDFGSSTSVSSPPGVQFTRETWWDALLATYSSFPAGTTMTADMRDTTTQIVISDLRFLFQNALHWFAFVNIPRFFARLWDPYHRQNVQPSLIYSALGLAVFFQSSELEKGVKGREKALQLVDQARALFDASLSSGWIDIGLVQAAWLLAIFEMQAHPRASTARTRSAFKNLDSLIQSLSLTMLDIADPRTTIFLPGQVPIVPSTVPMSSSAAPPLFDYDNVAPGLAPPAVYLRQHGLVPGHSHAYSHTPLTNDSQWQCGCSSYSLGNNWPISVDLAPAWTCTPMWPDNASEGDMQKEECRRLVWSTVMLTASHNTKTTAGTDREPQHLWIKDPANYALLFPGESLVPFGVESIAFSKDSVWALYMRVLFLWHSSLRQRADTSQMDADRAAYAMSAWLELDNVETCLDRHTCGIQSGYMMQMREVLFNTRMVVSNEFKRYIPEATTSSGHLFYRERVERWMTYMLATARHFLQSFKGASSEPDRNNRRCFMMYWFMSQIMRALALWHADPSLSIALDVAKTFAPCVEYMMIIWPSRNQRREYEALRGWLVRSCMNAGVPAPERAIPFVPAPRPQVSSSKSPPDPIVTAGAYSHGKTQL
ncbi:transcription factor [Ganoderma sinense ZZ0214-1]|uniref:Transcription factor n=1 Tax=Ganoderma sinense ZZ0214-1 TaxID=1077348 RepID=A0A2G8RQ57_9APHY|nr:transcription factor [Ganoderma sinense ZZ0214-1]